MKAIAIDCGNVLFSDGTRLAIDALAREYDRATIHGALHSPQSMQLRTGRMTERAFVAWLDRTLPEEYDAQHIMDVWHDAFTLDPGMMELVMELSIRYRLFIFSTNVRERVAILDRKYGFLRYFAGQIWSFDVHATKKEDAMHDALLAAVKVRPDELVIIDDEQAVLDIAAEKGVRGVRYAGDVRAVRRALRALGVDVIE